MVTWIYYGSNWRWKENAPLELKTKMSILPSRQGLSNIVCLLWLWWMFEDSFSLMRMRGSLQCLAQISDVNFRLMSDISDDTMSRVYGYTSKSFKMKGKRGCCIVFHIRDIVYTYIMNSGIFIVYIAAYRWSHILYSQTLLSNMSPDIFHWIFEVWCNI